MKRHSVGALSIWACLLGMGCNTDGEAKPTETGSIEGTVPTVTETSETTTTSTSSDDADGDGFSEADGDCDDGNPEAYPGAPEVCDAVDNDCDKEVDEDAVDGFEWYVDDDGDGFGLNGSATLSCPPSDGSYSLIDGDCDDTDADIHERHLELPEDGIDSNCDTVDGSFDDVHPGTVQLDTVDDQRRFCDYYVAIAGALYLPTSASTDLSALSDCLETVTGTVEITSETLAVAQLNALQTIGGHLVIQGASSLEEVVLPALENLERDLYVKNNPELIRLEVWDLCEVLNLSINENPNLEYVTMPSLEQVNGNLALRSSTWMRQFEAEYLKNISGDLILRDLNAFELLTLPRLENIGPEVSSDALVLEPGEQYDFMMINANVDAIDMPNLTSISGDMKLEQVFNGTLYELRSLRAVGGDVRVVNTGLVEFNFKELAHVGGDLLFEQNYYLSDLGGGAYEGLGGLTEVGGDFTLTYNHTMTSMSALFESMTTINGDYTVTYNAQLPESQAFAMADSIAIGGDTEIFGNMESATTVTAGTGGPSGPATSLPTDGTSSGSSTGTGTGTGS